MRLIEGFHLNTSFFDHPISKIFLQIRLSYSTKNPILFSIDYLIFILTRNTLFRLFWNMLFSFERYFCDSSFFDLMLFELGLNSIKSQGCSNLATSLEGNKFLVWGLVFFHLLVRWKKRFLHALGLRWNVWKNLSSKVNSCIKWGILF
jgi:hypothetical protein